MTLHLIKLAVGVEDVEELAVRQKRLLLPSGNPRCRTRMMPKRVDELLDGGSLYWVIKGYVQVRQPIVGIHKGRDSEGRACTLIELAPKYMRVQPVHKRPFQGWRYFKVEDVPADIAGGGKVYVDPAMPKEMKLELLKLGLL